VGRLPFNMFKMSYCPDLVVSEGMSQVLRQSEVWNINGAPGYLQALLRELSHVLRALTLAKVIEPKQIRMHSLYQIQNNGRKIHHHVSNQDLFHVVFQDSRPPFIGSGGLGPTRS